MNLYSSSALPGYTFLKIAGYGAFATVYKAENKKTHQICAIKVIPKPKKNNLSDQERLKHELRIQKAVHHPSVAKFFEAIEDQQNLYIITEYCSHGSLSNLILQNSRLPENMARKYFIQVVKCLKYLHEEVHVIHRDLKAENIMLDSCDNIKIIDFGLSIEFNPKQPFFRHTCGSPKYVAPEMFSGDPYTSSIDIWALGVNLFYWVCGVYPFDDTNLKKLSQKILLNEPSYPSYLSNSIIDLLMRLLKKDPIDRISLSEILEHPWILNNNMIKNSFYSHQIRKKFAKSGILSALKKKQENDDQMPNLSISLKKKEAPNADGLTHLFETQGSSAVDKLCATGKFKRKEKTDSESDQPKNAIVNAFLSSYVKKNVDPI